MQKVRGQAELALANKSDALPRSVGIRVQVLLTPLAAVLFNVQSPYWFAIGRAGVFSLGRWSARIHAGFHESRATLEPLEALRFFPKGLSPAMARLSRRFE